MSRAGLTLCLSPLCLVVCGGRGLGAVGGLGNSLSLFGPLKQWCCQEPSWEGCSRTLARTQHWLADRQPVGKWTELLVGRRGFKEQCGHILDHLHEFCDPCSLAHASSGFPNAEYHVQRKQLLWAR